MPANENHHQCTASDIVKDMMELNKKVLKSNSKRPGSRWAAIVWEKNWSPKLPVIYPSKASGALLPDARGSQ